MAWRMRSISPPTTAVGATSGSEPAVAGEGEMGGVEICTDETEEALGGGGFAGEDEETDEEKMSSTWAGIWDEAGLVTAGTPEGTGVCALSTIVSLSMNGEDKWRGGGVTGWEGEMISDELPM
jgi:hypothetical protein